MAWRLTPLRRRRKDGREQKGNILRRPLSSGQADNRLGFLLVFASALGWSTAGLFSRAIHADTATIIVWRGFAGAAGLIALILLRDGVKGLGAFARLGRAGWGYALCSGLGMLSFIGALQNTAVAHVAIIYATIPFVSAALAWAVLRERPSRGAMIASTAALAGAAIMVGFGGDGRLAGDLLAMAMVCLMAAMIVIARASPDLPTFAAGAVSAIWAPLVCIPFATTQGLTLPGIGMMSAFGLVNSALSLALFLTGSRHLPAVTTALVSALETPMTPLWVWLVFGETPTPTTIFGGLIVLASVLGYIWRESRR